MRLFSAALSLFVALTIAACVPDGYSVRSGGTPTSPGGSGLAGTYTLRTINGQSLPFTYATNGADTYVLLDDAFTLSSSGAWTESWHERHTVSGVASEKAFSDAGTYTSGTSMIVFTSTTPGTSQPRFEGSFSAGTLTMPGGVAGGPVETMIYMK